MANPAGETTDGALKLDFDRRLMLQFRGSVVTSDAGLLAYRELDDALGLSAAAGETLTDARTGKNGRHALVGLLRQSVFGRLAGYEDVNDAERLRDDPAMRWIIGGEAAQGLAASPSQMGLFETRWLTAERNLCALAESDIFTVYGYSAAQTMVALLKQCGDNLTRENVMKQAASILSEPANAAAGNYGVDQCRRFCPDKANAINEVRRHHLEAIWRRDLGFW